MTYDPDGNEAEVEEALIFKKYNERFEKWPYRQAFFAPSKEWHVDALFAEGYLESATVLLSGIASGQFPQGIHGVTAVFLCRHYLELQLKYTLYHSRWLKDENTNAPNEEIEAVGKDHHRLHPLWIKLRGEIEKKKLTYDLDLPFVGQFVNEFDTIDPNGMRFRYPGTQLPVQGKSHETLGIDFAILASSLKHASEVLDTLDRNLINTFGHNEEWESEMQSW